jgi:hypothetical protein
LYEDLPGEDYTIPLYAQVERCAATTDADAFGETLVHNLSQMRTLLSDDITVITIDIPEKKKRNQRKKLLTTPKNSVTI